MPGEKPGDTETAELNRHTESPPPSRERADCALPVVQGIGRPRKAAKKLACRAVCRTYAALVKPRRRADPMGRSDRRIVKGSAHRMGGAITLPLPQQNSATLLQEVPRSLNCPPATGYWPPHLLSPIVMAFGYLGDGPRVRGEPDRPYVRSKC